MTTEATKAANIIESFARSGAERRLIALHGDISAPFSTERVDSLAISAGPFRHVLIGEGADIAYADADNGLALSVLLATPDCVVDAGGRLMRIGRNPTVSRPAPDVLIIEGQALSDSHAAPIPTSRIILIIDRTGGMHVIPAKTTTEADAK